MVTWPAGQPEDHERAARSGDGGTVLRHLSRRPATLGWLIASSLGFAVLSAGLVFLGDDATVRSRAYTGTPQFKVWAVLVIALLALLPTIWNIGIGLLSRLGMDGYRLFSEPHLARSCWLP